MFLLPLLFLLKKDCNFTQFFFVGKRPCNLIGTGTFGSFLLNMMKNELLFFFFFVKLLLSLQILFDIMVVYSKKGT